MKKFLELNEAYSIRYQANILKTCKPLFQLLPIKKFFYQFVKKDGSFNFISTNAEICDFYFGSKMHLYNPFITQFDLIQSGIYLIDSLKIEKFQFSWKELASKFNLKHSFNLTRSDGLCCHQYGFCIPADREDLNTLLLNNMQVIKNFTGYFDQEMCKIIQDMHYQPLDLKKEIGSLFNKKVEGFPEVNMENTKITQFLTNIGASDQLFSTYGLTARDKECITLFLKGKFASDIAKELHLSQRTIEHRLESIKNKLNCHTKPELFSKLQGMMNY